MLHQWLGYCLIVALVITTLPARAMSMQHYHARDCAHVSMELPITTAEHAHHVVTDETPTQTTLNYSPICEKNCTCLANLCHVVQFFYAHQLTISPHLITNPLPLFTGLRFPAKLIAQIERPPKL
ncbi:hypothetical protein BegalDRAFT_0926 [Beggiatoa alba B18LD]|uniref:Uncharacterized protein n=1 Tax=Beggiatoa alba B18LD TaxID=395493 RepID=I3CDZ1_9GAMM|nr:hypothetical protein [Beggiatoa alba]EIJ41834.1 hypothetical protein BegalDRAFT_0926 [Beggiatoa alba B18LD]